MRRRFLGILTMLFAGLTGCMAQAADSAPTRFSTQFVGAMDTVVQLIAYCMDEAEFTRAVQAVRGELERQEALLDIHRPDSAVSRVNAAAGGTVACPTELCMLVARCQALYERVPGTNIAMGAVLRLWEDARVSGVLPDEAALRRAGGHIALSRVDADPENGEITITDPAQSLDLGAVGKGYAADAAAVRLHELGVTSFLLDFGESTMVCAGAPPESGGWTVAVREPDAVLNLSGRREVPEYSGTLTLADRCLGVSGDYQKYFASSGIYYAHILEESTLYPARYCRAVCVLAPDAFAADYLSTALFAQPYAAAREAAENLPNVDVLWIFADGSREMTPGFAEYWRDEE